MKKHLLTCIFAAPLLLFAQQTYVWNVTSGSWTDPVSWSPQRNTPQPDDILEFSSNASVTDVPVSEDVGRLRIYNNAVVTINSSVSGAITVGHEAVSVPHFFVEAGSSLHIAGGNVVSINIGVGYSGEVRGNIDFFDGAHRLTAKSAGALIFKNGSVFTANTGFDGNAFGTVNLNSVVFENGAQYVNRAGGNPFGAAAPNAVTIFQSGSIFWYQRNGVGPSMAGRSFGHFYIDGNLNFAGIGSSRDCIIRNDLRVVSGFFSFKPNTNGTHTGNFNIYGDIICEGTSYIDIGSDNMPGAVQLLGTNQLIGSGAGSGTITLGNVTVNNNHTELKRHVTITGTLNMQNGIIKTTATTLLKLLPTAGIQTCTHDYTNLPYTNIGCDNAYVDGPMQKQGLGNEDFAFPVGQNGKLRPAFLRNATGDFTVEFINRDPYLDIGLNVSAGIHHISHIEYWNIAGSGDGQVELSFFDPNSGGVTDMAALRVAYYNGSQWMDMNTVSYLGTPGSNGSVTAGASGQFGYFSLGASTDYPNNPLPFILTRWDIIPGSEEVILHWSVSEKQGIKNFVIEKSEDQGDFRIFSTLPAAEGDAANNYQLIDKELLNDKVSYRLKVIYQDGRVYYSEILSTVLPLSRSLKVYPNPARGKIFIKIPPQSSIFKLAIVNSSGSIVKSVETRNFTIVCVDILNLSVGLYYIRSIGGQSPLAVPFIKYNQ